MGYMEANPSFKWRYRRGGSSGLVDFADSDWGNRVSRRWTTGMMARYNKTIVQWCSKMQKTIRVSLSTVEAEYYAVSEMAIEVIYLRNLLDNIGFPREWDTPVN
jgi:hypothetical protein